MLPILSADKKGKEYIKLIKGPNDRIMYADMGFLQNSSLLEAGSGRYVLTYFTLDQSFHNWVSFRYDKTLGVSYVDNLVLNGLKAWLWIASAQTLPAVGQRYNPDNGAYYKVKEIIIAGAGADKTLTEIMEDPYSFGGTGKYVINYSDLTNDNYQMHVKPRPHVSTAKAGQLWYNDGGNAINHIELAQEARANIPGPMGSVTAGHTLNGIKVDSEIVAESSGWTTVTGSGQLPELVVYMGAYGSAIRMSVSGVDDTNKHLVFYSVSADTEDGYYGVWVGCCDFANYHNRIEGADSDNWHPFFEHRLLFIDKNYKPDATDFCIVKKNGNLVIQVTTRGYRLGQPSSYANGNKSYCYYEYVLDSSKTTALENPILKRLYDAPSWLVLKNSVDSDAHLLLCAHAGWGHVHTYKLNSGTEVAQWHTVYTQAISGTTSPNQWDTITNGLDLNNSKVRISGYYKITSAQFNEWELSTSNQQKSYSHAVAPGKGATEILTARFAINEGIKINCITDDDRYTEQQASNYCITKIEQYY